MNKVKGVVQKYLMHYSHIVVNLFTCITVATVVVLRLNSISAPASRFRPRSCASRHIGACT